jgi:hypothetical protein
MDSRKWDMFESLFDELDIKPIIAVIPNNKDSDMLYEQEDKFFWDKVRRWQSKGWHIALHGYEHLYETKNSGIVPINQNSEFAGVDLAKQKMKISNGWDIFKKEHINAKIWIAPAHTFDENTIKALLSKTDIKIISDGFSFFPFWNHNILWIPQQLWRFKKKIFPGIYTICYHPNITSVSDIQKELILLKENRNSIIDDIDSLYKSYKDRKRSLFDKMYEFLFFTNRKLKKIVKLIIFYDFIKKMLKNEK